MEKTSAAFPASRPIPAILHHTTPIPFAGRHTPEGQPPGRGDSIALPGSKRKGGTERSEPAGDSVRRIRESDLAAAVSSRCAVPSMGLTGYTGENTVERQWLPYL